MRNASIATWMTMPNTRDITAIPRLGNERYINPQRTRCIGVTYAIVVMTRRGSCVKLNADYTLARCHFLRLLLLLLLLVDLILLLLRSFFSVYSLRISTSTTQSRDSRTHGEYEPRGRGGCFTQSVAIIEYLPARLSCPNDPALGLARIAACALARRIRARVSTNTCPAKMPGAAASRLPTVITCRLGGQGQKSANRHQSRRIRENRSR